MAADSGAISATLTKVGLDFVSSATCHFVCLVRIEFFAAALRRGTQYAHSKVWSPLRRRRI